MAIAIVSANTGNGHRSVMNSLIEAFKFQGYDELIIHDSFYEECLASNKILSDFYNFLIAVSIPLGEKYTELAALTRPDMSDDIYFASHDKLSELVENDDLDAIVSTAPLINYNIIRILKEKGLTEKIPFYIIVTDPYDPIAPGFDVQGASRYFCFSESVKNILLKENISEERLCVTHYPVSKRFLKSISDVKKKLIFESLNFEFNKTTVLINSGAHGNNGYLKILMKIHGYDKDLQIIFITGKNKLLKDSVEKYVKSVKATNISVLSFVDNLDEYLQISDLCISKAGANTFYECLATNTYIIVDAVNGLLYQEKGVIDAIGNTGVGAISYSYEDTPLLINDFLKKSSKITESSFNKINGAEEIVSTILRLLYQKK